MPLNSSGQISLAGSVTGQSVALELGRSATGTISLNDSDVRSLFGVPTGQISLSQGWGKANAWTKGLFFTNPGKKINIATQTFSISPTMTSTTGGIRSAVSDTSFMWMGGQSASPSSSPAITATKFSFSSEALVGVTSAALVTPRRDYTSVSASGKGYFAGGYTPPIVRTNQVDGIFFSTDSSFDVAAGLVQSREALAAYSAPSVQSKGYFQGGETGPWDTPSAQIDGINYTNDSIIDPAAGLVLGRADQAAIHSETRGYTIAGGYPWTGNATSEIDGFIFSTETTINPANLSENRNSMHDKGVSGLSKGWITGGGNFVSNPIPPNPGNSFVFDFATETSSIYTSNWGGPAVPFNFAAGTGVTNANHWS